MQGQLRRTWSLCFSSECIDGGRITGIVICLHMVEVYIYLHVFIHIFYRQVHLN